MKAQKKPVTIDYFEIETSNISIEGKIQEWMKTFGEKFDDHFFFEGENLKVRTLEGTSYFVNPDLDYILRGVSGEYYPCKKDIFELTYDRI